METLKKPDPLSDRAMPTGLDERVFEELRFKLVIVLGFLSPQAAASCSGCADLPADQPYATLATILSSLCEIPIEFEFH